MSPEEIVKDIYLVGGSQISDSRDCSVYLLDLGELVLVDAGAGPSAEHITEKIRRLGLDPSKISTVILTHCHIDHVGGARWFRERFGARIIMHELDAGAIEEGDERLTAAFWYNMKFLPLPVDVKLAGGETSLIFGGQEVVFLHTPGHTPGSMSVYLDREGRRILFGQDIHGPFFADFGSNMEHWHASMKKLLGLKADILCEGHFGVYRPAEKVIDYIERYIDEYGE